MEYAANQDDVWLFNRGAAMGQVHAQSPALSFLENGEDWSNALCEQFIASVRGYETTCYYEENQDLYLQASIIYSNGFIAAVF